MENYICLWLYVNAVRFELVASLLTGRQASRSVGDEMMASATIVTSLGEVSVWMLQSSLLGTPFNIYAFFSSRLCSFLRTIKMKSMSTYLTMLR